MVKLKQLLQGKSKEEMEEDEMEEGVEMKTEDEAMEEESGADDLVFEMEAAIEETLADKEELEESSE